MLERMARLSNNLKMKNKLILSFILIVMVPVLIIGGTVTFYFREQALDNAIDQATNNVEKIKTQTLNMLRVPTDISNSLLFDEGLKELVNTRYEGALDLTKSYLSYTKFKDYVRQYKEISGIRFYMDNPTLVNNLEYIPLDEQIKKTHWYQKTAASKNIGWFYIPDEEASPVHKLSLVRKVIFPEYHSSGILMVEMNQGELNGMLRQEQFDTYIADEQGYVIAASKPVMVGKLMKDLSLGLGTDTEYKGAYKKVLNDKASYVITDNLTPDASMNGLRIISVFTTESIVKDANHVSMMGFWFMLLVLVIALIFVYIVSVLTTGRLLRLSRQLNQVALGKFDVVSTIDGNDEIGQLSRQFNYMVSSIQQLMRQVVEKTEHNQALEIAQKEITLKMMASQINPHFLFNALESIRMNALLKGDREIAQVVRLLGKLMRKNLEAGREKTTLQEEVEMIRSYLEIQKFRYEERLDYTIIVDTNADKVMIPPLIIQPLVENAVVHGMEDKPDGVQVNVRIQEIGQGSIRIEVEDNGTGITEERMDEIVRYISGPEDKEKRSIGLRNVHQRLCMVFGPSAGLHIRSKAGIGTTIYFEIPAKEA
ncbi:sensor histidine kinase [Paenibacillus sp. J22TS3]|uniref:sensor histidine kinase n=1 Tax=Paenibacillus sp. J22TS3 TaxID=2807192 RepID=UPI001B178BA8|nr:sensor histidine kinase [Paenibacillus sp. J22TS3]GIP23901.1 two-component sensor histidine kinase [Paenibacillus sp. J22TS3]